MAEAEVAAALGPRWSPRELRTFYILLKAHGEQWGRLAELLPRRSAAMMRTLADLHRQYLALPEASAEGFCAVMTDHYKAQDERAGSGDQHSPAGPRKRESGASSDGGADRGSLTPKIKKKRRLDRMLAMEGDGGEQLERQTREQLRIRAESDVEMQDASGGGTPTKARRAALPPKKARWHLRDPNFDMLQGRRFDLPWYCWFHACDDADFFLHDEFIDCLNRMGLVKLRLAARPIWSSVRSSMGHPRRLSPSFFQQEKQKLKEFREIRRSAGKDEVGANDPWPQVHPLKLEPGTKVLVWMEMHQRFLLGTAVVVSPSEGVCSVTTETLGDNGKPEKATVLCPLSSVMAIDFLQADTKAKATAPQRTATLLRRSNTKKKRGRQARSASQTFTSNQGDSNATLPLLQEHEIGDFHTNRLQAMLTVKDLLQRKEKLVNAINLLNNVAADTQRSMTITKGLSKGKKSTSRGGPSTISTLQQQHEWLVESMEDTNTALKAALLRLNAFTTPPENVLPGDEVLSVKEMRWALEFLKGSQQRAATMVDTHLTASPSASVEVLKETKQVIASSLCLMSVFTAANNDVATSIPSAVLQKLVERMVGLLKPKHAENMDLYAELKAATDGLQAKFSLQSNSTL